MAQHLINFKLSQPSKFLNEMFLEKNVNVYHKNTFPTEIDIMIPYSRIKPDGLWEEAILLLKLILEKFLSYIRNKFLFRDYYNFCIKNLSCKLVLFSLLFKGKNHSVIITS